MLNLAGSSSRFKRSPIRMSGVPAHSCSTRSNSMLVHDEKANSDNFPSHDCVAYSRLGGQTTCQYWPIGFSKKGI